MTWTDKMKQTYNQRRAAKKHFAKHNHRMKRLGLDASEILLKTNNH